MKVLNVLKWLGLGVAIWGVSLLWPEINLALTPPVMAGLVLALAAIILAYILGYYHSRIDQGKVTGCDGGKQKHSSRPSRPVPPLSMA
jgi:hypothetical protein